VEGDIRVLGHVGSVQRDVGVLCAGVQIMAEAGVYWGRTRDTAARSDGVTEWAGKGVTTGRKGGGITGHTLEPRRSLRRQRQQHKKRVGAMSSGGRDRERERTAQQGTAGNQ
jgi:hypothetical protein